MDNAAAAPHSCHLGNAKRFASSVPGARDADHMRYFLFYPNTTPPCFSFGVPTSSPFVQNFRRIVSTPLPLPGSLPLSPLSPRYPLCKPHGTGLPTPVFFSDWEVLCLAGDATFPSDTEEPESSLRSGCCVSITWETSWYQKWRKAREEKLQSVT